jgi:O-antigen/teichoic acid export membrane protein
LAPGQSPLVATAIVIPFALYAQGARGMLLAAGRTGDVAWQGAVSSSIFGVILIPMLIFLRVPAFGALAVWGAAQVAAGLYTLVAIKRLEASTAAEERGRELPATLWREQMRFGFKASAPTIAAFVNQRIDVFLVSLLLGPKALGVYTLAITSGELLWNVSLPVAYSSVERITAEAFADAARTTARLMRNVVTMQSLLGAILFAGGPWLVTLLYGPAFADSGTVLRILMPGLVLYSTEAFVGYFMMVRLEKPMLLFGLQCSAAALCAIITFFAAPRFGIVAAAWATTVTYCAEVVIKALYFRARTGIGLREQFIPTRSDLVWCGDRLRTLLLRRA